MQRFSKAANFTSFCFSDPSGRLARWANIFKTPHIKLTILLLSDGSPTRGTGGDIFEFVCEGEEEAEEEGEDVAGCVIEGVEMEGEFVAVEEIIEAFGAGVDFSILLLLILLLTFVFSGSLLLGGVLPLIGDLNLWGCCFKEGGEGAEADEEEVAVERERREGEDEGEGEGGLALTGLGEEVDLINCGLDLDL